MRRGRRLTPEPVGRSTSARIHCGSVSTSREHKVDAHVAAELAVGDGLDADIELALDLVLDGLVLDGLELVAGALALVELVALGEERVGACARTKEEVSCDRRGARTKREGTHA